MSSYEHGLEFDAYQEGVKAERERIIKLLEERKSYCHSIDYWEVIEGLDAAIDVIEGENK